MALENENGMVMPVAPYGGAGSGFGDFGGSGWWILLLFLLIGNNGWGNWGGNGGADMFPWMNNSNQMTAGFQNAALSSAIGDMQLAMNNGFNNMQTQFAQCCCDNKLAVADLKYTVATEAAADRAAISSGIRDVLESGNRNTQAILDKLCALELAAKNDRIAELQNQLNIATFDASQKAQDNYIQNALTAQTQYFLGLYPPTTYAANKTASAS